MNSLCVNGCDKPIHPPSKVICKDCIDKITDTMQRMIKEMETGVRDTSFDK